MPSTREPIAVVGTGYVGLVTAASFGARGHDVYCVEKEPRVAEQLVAGKIPFYEPQLEETFAAARARLHFDLDYESAWRQATKNARLIFLAVGTPSRKKAPSGGNGAVADGTPQKAKLDRTQITRALEDGVRLGLQDRVDNGEPTAIVMKSTVPPGTGRDLRRLMRSAFGHDRLAYVSCPEFLREGNAIDDFSRPDRVVIGGSDPWAVDAVASLFSFARGRVMRTSVPSAELVKMASNGFLALAISYANELANLCDDLRIDYAAVLEEMRRIREEEIPRESFLTPGPGFGGSCFPKDVREFNSEIRRADPKARLFDAVLDVNKDQPRRVVDKLEQRLGGSLKGKRIALLGLSFKAGTDDMREASSGRLARELVARGAEVVAFDPAVKGRKPDDRHTEWMDADEVTVDDGESPYRVLENADAAMLVTDWDDLVGLDWRRVAEAMAGDRPPLLDARNALDADAMSEAGLAYDGVGRRVAASPQRFGRNDIEEFAELAADGYLALKREFTDELNKACRLFKADVGEVAEGVGRDVRIGLSYLDPGAPQPPHDLDGSVDRLLAKCPPGHMRLLRSMRLRAS